MGTCNLKERSSDPSSISIDDFNLRYVVGTGGYGEVWKVRRKKDSETLALKVLSKRRILHHNSVDAVTNERRFLAHLSHP